MLSPWFVRQERGKRLLPSSKLLISICDFNSSVGRLMLRSATRNRQDLVEI